MLTSKFFSRPILYVVTVLYIIVSYSTLSWGDRVVAAAVREDQFFELVGALGFFVASILFFLSFWRIRRDMRKGAFSWLKPLVFLGLAAAFLFGAGEEISWGQRIFNIATPEEIKAINDQGEITIHNLDIGGMNIPFDTMFDLLWASFAFALPLAALFFKPLRQFVEKYIPLSHWGIGLLFLFNYLWAKVARVIYEAGYTYDRVPFRQGVQEIKESHYAVLFVMVALFIFLAARESSSQPAETA